MSLLYAHQILLKSQFFRSPGNVIQQTKKVSPKLVLQAKRQILIQRRGAALALKIITEDCGADLTTKMEYLWDAVCAFLSKTQTGIPTT